LSERLDTGDLHMLIELAEAFSGSALSEALAKKRVPSG
jgi:hypothetical protein